MKKSIRFSLLIFICLTCLSSFVFAQSFLLQLQGENEEFQRQSKISRFHDDFNSCRKALQISIKQLHEAGYLCASIDSLRWTDSSATAQIFVGKKFAWASLKNNNIPTSLLQQLHFQEKEYFDKPIQAKKITALFERVLKHFEDNGHPFASIKLENVEIVNDKLKGEIKLEKGQQIRLDTIYINEDARINRKFLLAYLGLNDGMLYNESKIRNISLRIKELNFLQELYPWRISFTAAKSNLSIYVKNKSANRADVLIGLLPNNIENQGKFLLTGDIKLAIVNALGRGEKFQLNWQNLQAQSPRYNIEASYPYLLHTPFGLQGKFDFYKKDTSFRLVSGEMGLLYQFNAHDYLKIFYELSSNRLGTINTSSLIAYKRLPDNADVTYRSFGAEINYSRLDYRLNPRKGYRFYFKSGIALRNFIRNTTIEQTLDPSRGETFKYLYDSIQLKSNRYNILCELNYFFNIKQRLIFASLYHGGITFSNDNLYRNELFQIGGYRLMRGFDEGSLFVNQYHVFTFEPRFLIGINSYFFTFGDLGFIQSKFAQQFQDDMLYSLGGGMTFETRAGLFNINYALGGRQNQGIQFRNSKIHFGYISVF
jgi:hemolysin activation/secretion protein